MDVITLKAEARDLEKVTNDVLREQGSVPAVLYGPKMKENQNLVVLQNELTGAYAIAGGSSLVDLAIQGSEPTKVIVKALQRDPLTDEIVHADFYQVDMTKEVSTIVKLSFSGVAPAVKELGGTLIKARDSIEVIGLPDKLVASIDVDISSLATFDDVIHVKDLAVPEGLSLDMDPERAVALVNPPRTDAEMDKLDEAPVDEVAEEAAAEEEEGKEGEAAEGETAEGGEDKKNE